MQEEYILSGYCRTLDQSRMVTVETDGRQILDVDCCYGSCPYEPSCTIAQKIREIETS